MNIQLAPNTLFLAYAVGCIDSLLSKQTITVHEHARLRILAQTGEEPSDELMERCFPKACMRIGYPRTPDRVQRFWRVTHQNPFEESPVYIVEVTKIIEHSGMFFVEALCRKGRTQHARVYENIRRLPLASGDVVYVHGMVVAEKC